MATATLKNVVIAESDETVEVEGNHYFPPASIKWDVFEETTHETTCPWKGVASYYTVTVDGSAHENVAWTYHKPLEAANNIAKHVAFYPIVQTMFGQDRDTIEDA